MPVPAGGITDPASRITGLVDSQAPKIKEAFLVAVVAIRDRHTLEQLAALLERGQIEEALAALDRAAEHLAGASQQSLTTAARGAAEFLTGALGVTISFNQTNVRAVELMQASRLELIQQFTAEQRAATRLALTDGIQRGLNPVEQARAFQGSIGLTVKQQQAVLNYESMLRAIGSEDPGGREALTRTLRDKRFDRTVLRALEDGDPLTPAQINRMVERYREKYVAFRARTIARTEALRTVHQGTEELYQQAIEMGELDAATLVRKWITARDERVRGSHRALNGVEKAIGEPWVTSRGRLRYPGDPSAPSSEVVNCRCALTTRINAL